MIFRRSTESSAQIWLYLLFTHLLLGAFYISSNLPENIKLFCLGGIAFGTLFSVLMFGYQVLRRQII